VEATPVAKQERLPSFAILATWTRWYQNIAKRGELVSSRFVVIARGERFLADLDAQKPASRLS
jgi:hypothetical protein